MNARKALFWVALAGLGVLGWFSVLPLWTEGLGGPGGVTLDADGQPGLWRWTVMVALVFAGNLLGGAGIGACRDDLVEARAFMLARATSAGFLSAALVLFLALAGQPLRSWFLFEHVDPGNQASRAALGFVSCFACLLLAGPLRRKIRALLILVYALGYVGLMYQFGGMMLPMGLWGSPCFLLLVRPGYRPAKSERNMLKWAGGVLAVMAAMSLRDPLTLALMGAAAVLALLAACRDGLGHLMRCAEIVVCLALPVFIARLVRFDILTPSSREWLVLAFATGCGLMAAWGMSRGRSGEAREGGLENISTK